jgi:hypothetical protein
MKKYLLLLSLIGVSFVLVAFLNKSIQPKFKYSDFETPKYCGTTCHRDIYNQWAASMMSQAYTHEWDEIEYFELALPHARLDEKVAEVEAGCNGCHAPLAYLTGDIPPKPPSAGTRANESVSCEVCHLISGFEGDIPYNFNYIIKPGKTKYNSRLGEVGSPVHKIEVNPIMKTGDFCGICHNEKSPYGVWVKSTHLEWKEGPYAKENVHCQDCHMPRAQSIKAAMGKVYFDTRQHIFAGAHDPSKVRGTIELKIYPDHKECEPGDNLKITVTLYNQKTGHKFPTGSVEDRLVWLELVAIDENGTKYHIPVDKKGFPGEEYTISSKTFAYQDMGVPLKDPNFKGLERDDIPEGNRIYRMPYFDPQGRMTIQQWNTASLGVDYRIGPRETKIETFTFHIPDKIKSKELTFQATLYYQLLVSSVGKYLKVPEEEYRPLVVNTAYAKINIID